MLLDDIANNEFFLLAASKAASIVFPQTIISECFHHLSGEKNINLYSNILIQTLSSSKTNKLRLIDARSVCRCALLWHFIVNRPLCSVIQLNKNILLNTALLHWLGFRYVPAQCSHSMLMPTLTLTNNMSRPTCYLRS